MLKKLLSMLVLFLFSLQVLFGGDILTTLTNIEIKLVQLENNLRQKSIDIENYKKSIQILSQDLVNYKNISNEKYQIISDALSKQTKLLEQSQQDYQEILKTYQELLKQSENLKRKLKASKDWNKILLVSAGLFLTASIIEGIYIANNN